MPGALPGAGGAGKFRALPLAGAAFFFLNGFIFLSNSPGGGGGGGGDWAKAVDAKPIMPKLITPANSNLAAVFLMDLFFADFMVFLRVDDHYLYNNVLALWFSVIALINSFCSVCPIAKFSHFIKYNGIEF